MDSVRREGRISRRRFLRTLAAGGAAVGAGAAGPGLFWTRPGSAAGVATDTLIVGQDTAVQTFDPQIVRKRQRRLSGVDEVVLSLYAKGLTTGEISAHFAEIYGASVSKET